MGSLGLKTLSENIILEIRGVGRYILEHQDVDWSELA
jgi:hypothetical protein